MDLAAGRLIPAATEASNRRPHGLQRRDRHLLHFRLVLGPRAVAEGVSHAAVGAAERALKFQFNANNAFGLKRTSEQGPSVRATYRNKLA